MMRKTGIGISIMPSPPSMTAFFFNRTDPQLKP
jgi:hypothetical protein